MNKHTRSIAGFGVLEIIIVLAVIAIIGATGFVYFSRSMPAATGGDWLTYHSPNSTVSFKYPRSWSLTNVTEPDKAAYQLDDVKLAGPNGFIMYYSLNEPHPNPAMSCASTPHQAPVALNDRLSLVPQGPADAINILYLVPKPSAPTAGNGCGLGFYDYPVTTGKNFQFSAHYVQNTTKPTAEYLGTPEVVTAKAIFGSFTY